MKQFFKLIKSILNFNYSEIFHNITKALGEKFVKLKIMKKKMRNLEKTNFDLGLKRMQENEIWEAIFRFRLVKKFWPKNKEAYIKLIECLMIKGKKEKAQKVAKELIIIDSSYHDKINKILEK